MLWVSLKQLGWDKLWTGGEQLSISEDAVVEGDVILGVCLTHEESGEASIIFLQIPGKDIAFKLLVDSRGDHQLAVLVEFAFLSDAGVVESRSTDDKDLVDSLVS